jgi:hypothetical protein
MEISKVPPSDAATPRADPAAVTDRGSPPAASVVPPADRADIRPLDVAGALLILLAEVRAGLDLPAEAIIPQGAITQGPVQAAHELIDMFLQVLPEDTSDAAAWTAALVRVDAAAQSSIERALSVVIGWRDVPPAVVDAVKESRALFSAALGDETPNPLWLRPEWVGLAPRIRRFRRRRRDARRRLTDPDYAPPGSLDESEQG